MARKEYIAKFIGYGVQISEGDQRDLMSLDVVTSSVFIKAEDGFVSVTASKRMVRLLPQRLGHRALGGIATAEVGRKRPGSFGQPDSGSGRSAREKGVGSPRARLGFCRVRDQTQNL
jgi:hypothetical protein